MKTQEIKEELQKYPHTHFETIILSIYDGGASVQEINKIVESTIKNRLTIKIDEFLKTFVPSDCRSEAENQLKEIIKLVNNKNVSK